MCSMQFAQTIGKRLDHHHPQTLHNHCTCCQPTQEIQWNWFKQKMGNIKRGSKITSRGQQEFQQRSSFILCRCSYFHLQCCVQMCRPHPLQGDTLDTNRALSKAKDEKHNGGHSGLNDKIVIWTIISASMKWLQNCRTRLFMIPKQGFSYCTLGVGCSLPCVLFAPVN